MPKITTIQEAGNQLVIVWDDGTRQLAYPTMGGVWVVSTDGSGGGGSGIFSWPYGLSHVSSEYGWREWSNSFHYGIDFAGGPAADGQPIPAAAAGTVFNVGGAGSYGNFVDIDHGNVAGGANARTLYAHMKFTPLVGIGASVSKGQTIGYVGNTGGSFGSHLHFETRRAGARVNPRDFMASYGDGGVIYA